MLWAILDRIGAHLLLWSVDRFGPQETLIMIKSIAFAVMATGLYVTILILQNSWYFWLSRKSVMIAPSPLVAARNQTDQEDEASREVPLCK